MIGPCEMRVAYLCFPRLRLLQKRPEVLTDGATRQRLLLRSIREAADVLRQFSCRGKMRIHRLSSPLNSATLHASALQLTIEAYPINLLPGIERGIERGNERGIATNTRELSHVREQRQRIMLSVVTVSVLMVVVTYVHHARILATTVYLYNSLVIKQRTHIRRFAG